MGKQLTMAEKAERAVRVANRLGVDVRQVIDARPGAPFTLPYKFGLFGGLSEHASDEYEQQIARHLIQNGRGDLVVQNDDASYRVLPLMRFNYDTDFIAALEKQMPKPEAMQALQRVFDLGKLTAVMNDCDSVALACNTHQLFMTSDAKNSGAYEIGAREYDCPLSELSVIDIAAPVLERLDQLGLKEDDAVLLLGTTLTTMTGNYWPASLAQKRIRTERVPAEAQARIDSLIYNDVAWHARAGQVAAETVSDAADMRRTNDKLHRGWLSMLQHFTAQSPDGKPVKAVIEACTDFVAPLSAAEEGLVPGTGVPVLNTMELHTASIAEQIAREAPEFTAAMRESYAAHPPHKVMFIGMSGLTCGFVPKPQRAANDQKLIF